MKFILISLLVIGALSSGFQEQLLRDQQDQLRDLQEQLLRDLYNQWKQTYGKEYSQLGEEDYRFNVFVQNYIEITEYNKNDDSVTLALNQFADLTSDEFAFLYTGLIPQEGEAEVFEFDTTQDPPASVDWRTKGAVTPVKNQGMCGSCWAFAAVGALEGLYFLNNSQLISFSEQNIVDCDKVDHGCQGGWPNDAFLYAAQEGLETEADYPYKGLLSKKCTFDSSKAHAINTGYYNVTPGNLAQMKAAIAQQPVSVAVQASAVAFQFYRGGVIKKLCGAKLDHAVLAVGYDVIDGTEAYIVKNSWGEKWGNNGYVYISTDASANNGQGVCGILSVPSIPANKK